MMPAVLLSSLAAGNGVWPAPVLSLILALIGVAQATLSEQPSPVVLGLAFVGQAAALTAAFAGHPWQIDAHMMFFVLMAALTALLHVPTILIVTVAIAVHHLSFGLLLPSLVFPSDAMLENIPRSALHAIIVLAEAVILIAIVRWIRGMYDAVGRHVETLEGTREELAASRDAAIAAREMSERERARASEAQSRAEAALARLEDEQREAVEADRRLKTQEAKVRRAAERETEIQRELVERLGHGLRALARRDLTYRVASDDFPASYDQLRTDFNSASMALGTALTEVADQTELILREINSVSGSASALSASVDETTSRLSAATDRLGDAALRVRAAADIADDAVEIARGAREEAAAGGEVVSRASTAMAELDAQARTIGAIVDVIEQLAFQTNMLALNAGIEAARAGEAGKGFAVVAAEVRALAQQSSKAAKDIADVVGASQIKVKDGVSEMGNAVEMLERMTRSVDAVADRMEEVSNAANAEAGAVGEISRSINTIGGATREATERLSQTAAAAVVMSDAARELQTLTDRFERGARSENVEPPASRIA